MQLLSLSILTSKLLSQIGSNFLFELFRDPFTISSASKSQLSSWIQKKGSECSWRLDEITHFPHSAWSSDAITESQSLRWFWRLYSLATFTCLLRSFSNDVRKMLIALKGWNTVHQHHFRFLITFNASVLQCALDAPLPTPNQSSRLTLPQKKELLWDFWKLIDKPLKKIWENCAPVTPKSQKKIQRNQLRLSGWTNLTKSIINLFFTRKSVFGNFVDKQAPGTPILTYQNYKAANPLPHDFSPSYWLMNTQRRLKPTDVLRGKPISKTRHWKFLENWSCKLEQIAQEGPNEAVQKDFMKLMMVIKERRVFLWGRKWNPARFEDAKLRPKNVMNDRYTCIKNGIARGNTATAYWHNGQKSEINRLWANEL